MKQQLNITLTVQKMIRSIDVEIFNTLKHRIDIHFIFIQENEKIRNIAE